MTDSSLHPRFAQPRVVEALLDSPAVLIHGPRQCGKTTLARTVGEQLGYSYLTFDDDTLRQSAEVDPMGFVADLPQRTIIDEVQRVPTIFSAMKLAIDRDRTPGRFLLTGSTNVLLVPALADSLAGRMDIVRLHPLAQCEIAGVPSRFVERVFRGDFSVGDGGRLGEDLAERITRGGYPVAVARTSAPRRSAWYRDYVDAIVQRDVREIAKITSLDALPRLLELVACQTARTLNVSDLAGPFSLSRQTIRDYLTLLERLFLAVELPAWHANHLKRLVKTPKLHMGDAGLAAALMSADAKDLLADRPLLGRLLETFVFNELVRLASFAEQPVRFSHWRDRDGVEVDVVLERGRLVAGVEVKASGTVVSKDFAGLRNLGEALGERFACGVVLYDGESCAPFGERLWAVPVSALWEAE
ncbi:MAG: ATP-binding protein [Coriobacteriia bacterium]